MHEPIDCPINVQVAQLRSAQEEAIRRVASCELQDAISRTRIGTLEDKIKQMVLSAEFEPVKWMVYGIASTTLAAVLTALVAGVLSSTPRLLH